MSFLTRSQAEELLARLMQNDRVDEIHAVLRSADGTVFRIAENLPDAPHRTSDSSLQITVRVGKQYGNARTNDLSEEGVNALVERAVRHASVMPEAPQVFPFPGADPGAPTAAAERAQLKAPPGGIIRGVIDRSVASDMRISGSIASTQSSIAVATSNGLFRYHPSDRIHAQFRVYANDGLSTGYGEHFSSSLDPDRIQQTVRTAIDKCAAWRNPEEIEPSRVTTVFEPRALADLLAPFIQQFSLRAIEEDHSFLRKLDGSSFVGTKMFRENVNLRSDPAAQGVISMPFTLEGTSVGPETWIRNGVIEQVAVDRYTAAQRNISATAPPTNLIMDGGEQSMDDLIAGTERGLLVSGFAELRMIDPKNCLLSGSTRDGLFRIEDGKIAGAVRNLMLRETPVYLFKELEEAGIPEHTSTTGSYFPMLIPPLRVKDVLYGASSGLI